MIGWLDPAVYPFPQCPFNSLTGYQCPGCGSQRAIHQLFHGHILSAIRLNALLLPGLVYAATGYALSLGAQKQWIRIRPAWYGKKAAIAWLMLLLLYWLGRNLLR